MPRRRHRVASSPELDEAPTPQPHPRTNMRVSTLQDREHFNLGDVSGSDSDAPTTQGGKNVINDPDGPMPNTAAADIHYFFDKSGDSSVCRECR